MRLADLDTKEHPLKLYALINAESGSTPTNSEDALRSELHALGLSADIVPVGAGELNSAVHTAIESRPDALIIWGGDGSVACALSASGPSGPPVLALPGGTMNLVHKRLHGEDMDWKKILGSALHAPAPEPFSAGCVSEHLFFVAAMMGQVTALAESREAARHGQLLKAAQLAINSDALTLDRRLRLESVHASGNQTFDAVAAAVVIGGAALTGGRGTVRGTILGALVIGYLSDGLVIIGVSAYWQTVFTGTVIVLAVLLNSLQYSSKGNGR